MVFISPVVERWRPSFGSTSLGGGDDAQDGAGEQTTIVITCYDDVDFTELVANAWDAGASKVEIMIPTQGNEFRAKDTFRQYQ